MRTLLFLNKPRGDPLRSARHLWLPWDPEDLTMQTGSERLYAGAREDPTERYDKSCRHTHGRTPSCDSRFVVRVNGAISTIASYVGLSTRFTLDAC